MKLGFEETQTPYASGSQRARAKHFFVSEIIEERKQLAPTARRARRIGSNILLGKIPESGKILSCALVSLGRKIPCLLSGIEHSFCEAKGRKQGAG